MTREQQEVKSGIGGWLILPAIGLVLNPIFLVIYTLHTIIWALSGEFQVQLVAHPGLGAWTFARILVSIALLGFVGVAAYLFFSKRSAAPRCMIALLLTFLGQGVIFTILDFAIGLDPEIAHNLIAPAFACAIWIPYFRVSKRVKATFGVALTGQQSRWLRFGSNVAVAIVLATVLVAVVMWFSVALLRGRTRSDWTASGRFSLSPRSKAFLKNLDVDVRITNLYSHAPEAPASEERYQRVQGLLDGYDMASGRVTVEDVNPVLDPGGVEKLVRRLRDRYAMELRKPERLIKKDYETLQRDVADTLEREAKRLNEAAAVWKGGPQQAQETLLMIAQVWGQLRFIGEITADNIGAMTDQALPDYSSALAQAKKHLGQVREKFEAVPDAFKQIQELAKDAPPPAAVKEVLDAASQTYEPLTQRIEAFEKQADVQDTELDDVRREIDRGDVVLVETFAEKSVIRTPFKDQDQLKRVATGAGAEKVVEPAEEGAEGFEVIAPPGKADAVAQALADAKIPVGSSEVKTLPDKIKVISFDEVWVHNPNPEGLDDVPDRLFAGETAVSSALLGMVYAKRPAILFVTSGGPATTGMPPMPGMMGGGMRGAYMEMADRLRKANFIVEDWNIGPDAEMPEPENASKRILVLVPPPPQNPQMRMPPPTEEAYRPAIDAIKGGAPAILLGEPATMFQQPVPYEGLFETFGVQAKFNAVAVHSVVVDAAGREKAFAQVELTHYEPHDITRPLGALPTMFLSASPLTIKKDLGDDLKAAPVVNMPGGRDYWADTVIFEAVQNRATRDDAEDLAGPLPLGVAVERKVGEATQKVVLFGDADLAQDRVAFYRETVLSPNGIVTQDRFPGNAELFVNACLWVSGTDHLITVSPEALQARRVGDLGGWQLPLQILIIGGLPAIVLAAGVLVYAIRRG